MEGVFLQFLGCAVPLVLFEGVGRWGLMEKSGKTLRVLQELQCESCVSAARCPFGALAGVDRLTEWFVFGRDLRSSSSTPHG